MEKDYDVVYTSEELGCIFTASEITELLEDIERMVRPSWLTKPPVLSGGKLKADDWRSLCTTTLPMSLIRLWADKTDEHHTVLLEMTLCLVSAVIVACSRSTSQQHADEYAAYMLRYRELLHSKFPDFVAKPNFHFALHIPEFLMMYGPVHGWWTFPFERLWGTLQNVPTNYMPGQFCPLSTSNSLRFNWQASTNVQWRKGSTVPPSCEVFSDHQLAHNQFKNASPCSRRL